MNKIKTPDDCGDNKVIFRYDDPIYYIGYYAGQTWNGWDCVRVDKATFDQLRKICEEQGGDVEDYDNAEADEFGLYSLDGHCTHVCGFTHKGIFVTNPFQSDCGRFEADPEKDYGLNHEELVEIFGENYKVLKN
jgi:hypothetical protein